MSADLKLAAFTTEVIAVLVTQTGLAVGDGYSPVSGVAAPTDYPYLVVNSPGDIEAEEDLLATNATVRKLYSIRAVGLTRVQAESAKDFARRLLDYGVAIATADAVCIGRDDQGAVTTAVDEGDLWNCHLQIELMVTLVV